MTEPPDMEKRPHYLELERLGEQYYEEMYDGRVRGRWSDVKECLDLAMSRPNAKGYLTKRSACASGSSTSARWSTANSAKRRRATSPRERGEGEEVSRSPYL